MKKVILLIFFFNSFSSLFGQSNPLEKAINVYLIKLAEQNNQKLDTLFVSYENKELEVYHKNIVANTFIKSVDYPEGDSKIVLFIDLAKDKNFRQIILNEKTVKYTEGTQSYKVFSSSSISIKFKYKKGCWKYINYHVNAL